MKTLIILILSMFLCSTTVFAQDSTDSLGEFKDVLNLQFSKIVTGNSFSNFGRYAAVSSTDESLGAALSFVRKNGHLINFELAGGATEGASAYFTNWKLNSDVKATITYHWLYNPFGNESVSRDYFEREKLWEEKQKIENDYQLALISINQKKELLDAQTSHTRIVRAGKNIQKSLDKVEQALRSQVDQNSVQNLNFKRDSLLFEREKNNFELKLIKDRLSKLSQEDYFYSQLLKLENTRFRLLKENEDKVRAMSVKSINITWFSFGYGMKNNYFKLYDSSLAYDDQISKQTYLSHGINFALSHYDWEAYNPNDRFWSVGLNLNLTNNIAALKSIEIEDRKQVSTQPDRFEVSTQKVFGGDYRKDLLQALLFLDYYKFFGIGTGDNSTLAIHINPKILFGEDVKTTVSLHTGLLIPFTRLDKQSSIVNLEVFYLLNDIFNSSVSGNSLLNRNTIGLQATFPINFLTTTN